MGDEPCEPGDSRRRLDEHWDRRCDLERQLHDGPALRIAALTLHIGVLAQKLRTGSGDVSHDIEDLQGGLQVAVQELRAIGAQIYPPLLRRAGLGAAVRELAAELRIPVHVEAGAERFDPAVEGVAYLVVRDVLGPLRSVSRMVDVTVRREAGSLALDLAGVDTGRGAAVRDRIAGLGGSVEIAGATIRVRIACE